jgi:hypothetical protein
MGRNYFTSCVLSVCVIASAFGQSTEPTSQPATYPWDQAIKHVGETVTITGPVKSTHATHAKDVVLNVGKDYPDTSRFTVFIPADGQQGMSADKYDGKNISVTGTIILYHNLPEIKAKVKDISVENP